MMLIILEIGPTIKKSPRFHPTNLSLTPIRNNILTEKNMLFNGFAMDMLVNGLPLNMLPNGLPLNMLPNGLPMDMLPNGTAVW